MKWLSSPRETSYTVEELMAMILENAKQNAEKFAEQEIKEAVITVPPYYSQAQRRALIRSAELAGLKVLQLMNDNTAGVWCAISQLMQLSHAPSDWSILSLTVALNYGVFRRKEFNSTAVQYMFVDMGATSTSASVVGEFTYCTSLLVLASPTSWKSCGWNIMSIRGAHLIGIFWCFSLSCGEGEEQSDWNCWQLPSVDC